MRPLVPTAALPPIPGVRLDGVLGRGGFATVYSGTQVSLERPVAVKVDSRALDDPRNRRRFLREVQASSRISGHPHVVSLIDTGVLEDGRPYLVMERCDGGNLADMIDQGPIPASDAVALIEAAASALGAAHSAGVLHRDVKPGNILLDSYGSPRLSDFGIAAIQREGQEPTVTLECLTPDYAPPEAFALAAPTPAGDVWSMGAVLMALVTGHGPRRGVGGQIQSLTQIVGRINEPVVLDSPFLPAAMVPVLARAMAPDPSDRFADGQELTAVLTTLREALGEGRMTVTGPITTLRLSRSPEEAPSPGSPTSTHTMGPTPPGTPDGGDRGREAPGGSAYAASEREVSLRRRALALGTVTGLIAGACLGVAGGWWAWGAQTAQVASGTPSVTETVQGTAESLPSPSEPAEPTPPGDEATENPQDTASPAEADNVLPPSVSTTGPAEPTPSPTPQPQINPEPPYAVGTCLKKLSSSSDRSTAKAVSCSKNHSWTVFAVGTLDPSTPSSLDDDMAQDPQVARMCRIDFARALIPDINEDAQTYVLGPSEAQWAAGQRGFSCLVEAGD